MTRPRSLIVWLWLVATSGISLLAEHPNVAKGFRADAAYEVGDIDSVNLFNGNVSLNIPIGMTYQGNGTLTYRFGLAYNSKSFDQEVRRYNTGCAPIPPEPTFCGDAYILTMPTRRSNAGMGWLFSLGRLISPWDPMVYPGEAGTHGAGWVYESPDGADHTFPSSHGVGGTLTPVVYTTDGSHLRLRVLESAFFDRFEVDFPNGMVHVFEEYGSALSPRLIRIRDPFGNYVRVDYEANGDWIVREYDAAATDPAGGELPAAPPVRTHHVRMKPATGTLAPDNAPPNYDTVIDHVDLAAFGGSRAVYQLDYTAQEVLYGCSGDDRWPETKSSRVPRLMKISLVNDASFTWDFTYHSTSSCAPISSVTLPTKGRIEWLYDIWRMRTAACNPPLVPGGDPHDPPFSETVGVIKKTVIVPGAANMEWTYKQTPELPVWVNVCKDLNGAPMAFAVPQQSRVTVTGSDARTDHFFSVGGYEEAASHAFHASEYGLPLTRSEGTGPNGTCALDDGDALCLSTRHYALEGNNWTLRRSAYVRYEGDTRYLTFPDEQYRREVERRTVFHDDANHFIHVKRSGYDGAGNFRKVTTTDSWSGLARVETTGYNPGQPDVVVDPATWTNTPASYRPPVSSKWFLSLYDSTSVTEGGATFKKEYWFASDTGFLNRQRVLKSNNGTRSGADLFTTYSNTDGLGNVNTEATFGGDADPVTGNVSLALPNMVLSSPGYRLAHQYQHGARHYSAYVDSNGAEKLRTLSATVDQFSGLMSSFRDPSDTQTTYSYDKLGRLTSVEPEYLAAATYDYHPATTGNPKVIQTVRDVEDLVLDTRTFEYDGLGRLIRESLGLPGTSAQRRRETTYDLNGRKKTVSEFGTAPSLPVTTFAYDEFGRTVGITFPDDSKATVTYKGQRQAERFVVDPVALGGATRKRATEISDGLGRLLQVIEKPDAASADILTSYGYDAGSRLTTVRMLSSSTDIVQNRRFHYDGRGFLAWDEHPESSMASYTYDARGHVKTKSQSAANSQFDLRFTYDLAERLTLVEGRDPGAPASFRPLKEFVYADDDFGQERRAGKLVLATRYNYPPPRTSGSDPAPLIRVNEFYQYQDVAGRVDTRMTQIEWYDPAFATWRRVRDISQSVSYNDQSEITGLLYPICHGCAQPPVNPPRNLTATYDKGWLTGLSDFSPLITYHPNGLRDALHHTNEIIDKQTGDLSGMARPGSIESRLYDGCSAPFIAGETSGGVVAPSGSMTLSADIAAGATTPLTVQWFDGNDQAVTSPLTTNDLHVELTVTPTQTREYYVAIANRCRAVKSSLMKVGVGNCVQPWVASVGTAKRSVGGYDLSVVAHGTGPLSYTWMQGTTVISTAGPNIVVNPALSTDYSVRVEGTCGGPAAIASLQVTIPFVMTSVVTAVRSGASIQVSWTATPGALSYTVERLDAGVWAALGQPVTGTSLPDHTAAAGKTYAYRVIARRTDPYALSAPSKPDVATRISFTPVAAGSYPTVAIHNELLASVNAARAMNGWAPVEWANILSPQDSLPAANMPLRGRHLIALRMRMNEALQAAGIPPRSYDDQDLVAVRLRAAHITELQERTR